MVSHAQVSPFSIENYSIQHGLPHKHINTILKHRDGFLWVGTRNGLARFDGYEFLPIPLPKRPMFTDGLTGPWVGRLKALSDGQIQLSYLKQEVQLKFVEYLFNPEDWSERIVDTSITNSIIEAELLNTKTYGDTIVTDDRVGNEIRMFKNNGKVHATLQPATGKPIDISKAFYHSANYFEVHGKDFTKCFFYSTFNGLMKGVPNITSFKNFLHNSESSLDFGIQCRAIFPLSSTELLVSAQHKKLILLDVDTEEHESIEFFDTNTGEALDTRMLTSIIGQSTDSLWAISHFDGLMLLNPFKKIGVQVPNQSFFRYHHMAELKDKSLIISGETKDERFIIARYYPKRPNTYHFIYEEKPAGKAVVNSFLLPTKQNMLWIGYSNGLYLYDLISNKIVESYKYKNDKEHIDNQVSDIHHLLEGKSVITLHENETGELLIGLEQGGLNILNLESKTIQSVSTTHGLTNATVAGIIPDDSGYWLSTYHGLCHYNPATKHIASYYSSQGLPHDEFNRFSYRIGQDDRYYFGSMNGMTSFLPEDILSDPDSVNIRLCEANYYSHDENKYVFQYSNFDGTPTFHIPAAKRACSFKFMLDDFTNSKGNTFAYRLLAQNRWFQAPDTTWRQNQTDRKIEFDYLPAGTYEMQVQGATYGGMKSNIYHINLVVHEHFYKSWWFFGLVGGLILGIIYSFYRMKVLQLTRIEKIRMKLSSDLHDDVGSLLSGIAYQMELLELTVDAKRKPIVQQLAASSRQAMNQMRDVVWAIDARNNSSQHLVERIGEYASKLLEPLNIIYQSQVDRDAKNIRIPGEIRRDVVLICKEFLTNTVKHAEASRVNLIFRKTRDGLLIELSDNGKCRFDPEKQSTGQGLKNMKMRADKINAQLNFGTEDGFKISLLLKDLK